MGADLVLDLEALVLDLHSAEEEAVSILDQILDSIPDLTLYMDLDLILDSTLDPADTSPQAPVDISAPAPAALVQRFQQWIRPLKIIIYLYEYIKIENRIYL